MLLLDDGTHFTQLTIAATKSIKASRPARMNWLHRVHWPVQQHTQVFPDSVVQQVIQRMMTWSMMAQRFVRQQPVRQQPVRQRRSILEAISSQLSALPPPIVKRMIPSPAAL